MLKRIMIILGVLVLVVVILCVAGYYYLIRSPLPRTDGEIQIKGLRAPVKVYRDRWGVPHIYAESEQDLFVAQGFVQAQDRLWQMESNRRVAAGRLSEIIGEEAIDLDRLLRTYGLLEAAKTEDNNDQDQYTKDDHDFLQHGKASLDKVFISSPVSLGSDRCWLWRAVYEKKLHLSSNGAVARPLIRGNTRKN